MRTHASQRALLMAQLQQWLVQAGEPDALLLPAFPARLVYVVRGALAAAAAAAFLLHPTTSTVLRGLILVPVSATFSTTITVGASVASAWRACVAGLIMAAYCVSVIAAFSGFERAGQRLVIVLVFLGFASAVISYLKLTVNVKRLSLAACSLVLLSWYGVLADEGIPAANRVASNSPTFPLEVLGSIVLGCAFGVAASALPLTGVVPTASYELHRRLIDFSASAASRFAAVTLSLTHKGAAAGLMAQHAELAEEDLTEPQSDAEADVSPLSPVAEERDSYSGGSPVAATASHQQPQPQQPQPRASPRPSLRSVAGASLQRSASSARLLRATSLAASVLTTGTAAEDEAELHSAADQARLAVMRRQISARYGYQGEGVPTSPLQEGESTAVAVGSGGGRGPGPPQQPPRPPRAPSLLATVITTAHPPVRIPLLRADVEDLHERGIRLLASARRALDEVSWEPAGWYSWALHRLAPAAAATCYAVRLRKWVATAVHLQSVLDLFIAADLTLHTSLVHERMLELLSEALCTLSLATGQLLLLAVDHGSAARNPQQYKQEMQQPIQRVLDAREGVLLAYRRAHYAVLPLTESQQAPLPLLPHRQRESMAGAAADSAVLTGAAGSAFDSVDAAGAGSAAAGAAGGGVTVAMRVEVLLHADTVILPLHAAVFAALRGAQYVVIAARQTCCAGVTPVHLTAPQAHHAHHAKSLHRRCGVALAGALHRLGCTPSRKRAISAFKITTVILLAAGIGVALRASFGPVFFWAPLTCAYLITPVNTGVFRTAVMRIAGTLFGAVVGYIVVAIADGSAAAVGALVAVTVALLFYPRLDPRGNAALIAAVTVQVVALGAGPRFSGVERLAIERIRQTMLGVACFLAVSMAIWPESARNLLHERCADAVGDLGAALDAAARGMVAALRQIGDKTAVEDCSRALVRAEKSLDAVPELLLESETEPDLWRPAFEPMRVRYSELLRVLRRLSRAIATIQAAQIEYHSSMCAAADPFASAAAATALFEPLTGTYSTALASACTCLHLMAHILLLQVQGSADTPAAMLRTGAPAPAATVTPTATSVTPTPTPTPEGEQETAAEAARLVPTRGTARFSDQAGNVFAREPAGRHAFPYLIPLWRLLRTVCRCSRSRGRRHKYGAPQQLPTVTSTTVGAPTGPLAQLSTAVDDMLVDLFAFSQRFRAFVRQTLPAPTRRAAGGNDGNSGSGTAQQPPTAAERMTRIPAMAMLSFESSCFALQEVVEAVAEGARAVRRISRGQIVR